MLVKSRHGLVKLTYSGDNYWCPCIIPSSLQQPAYSYDPDHLQGIVILVAGGQPISLICHHPNHHHCHHLRDHCHHHDHHHDRSGRAEEPILDLNPFSISALHRNLVVLRTRSSQAAQHFNFVEQKQGSMQWFDPKVFLFLRCIHLLCPRCIGIIGCPRWIRRH